MNYMTEIDRLSREVEELKGLIKASYLNNTASYLNNNEFDPDHKIIGTIKDANDWEIFKQNHFFLNGDNTILYKDIKLGSLIKLPGQYYTDNTSNISESFSKDYKGCWIVSEFTDKGFYLLALHNLVRSNMNDSNTTVGG